MDIAVTKMTKGKGPASGKFCLNCRHCHSDEIRHPRHRHRDIVLHRRAFAAQRRRDRIAQHPHGFGLRIRGGKRRIHDQARTKRLFHYRRRLTGQIGCGIFADQFNQYMPIVLTRQGRTGLRQIIEYGAEALLRHDLKPFKCAAEPGIAHFQQVPGRRDRTQSGPHDLPRRNRRDEPQPRRGDHPQCAFAADKHLFQIKAAVVFLERGQRRIDRAIGQHRFDPQHGCAHRPVAQHLGAAGIGGDQAADCGRSFASQGEGKAQARNLGCSMQVLQNNASPAGHFARCGVNRADLVKPAQRQQQLIAAGIGRGPA